MRMNVDWFKELLNAHEPPCISIYLPVYRAEPLAAENPRRYREQLDEVRASLSRDYASRDVRDVLETLESAPSGQADFWTTDRDAVAIFAAPNFLRVIDLHQPVDPAAFVADSFHVKPLIRVLQSDWSYHVLTFTQRHVGVLLGSGETRLAPLDTRNVPQTPDVVSKMRMSHQISATADLHTADTEYPGEGTTPAPVTLETFMRAVDKAVWENFSRDAKYPLILCGVEHYHAQFHAISKNTYLLEAGIKHDPQQIDMDRMRREAWAIMQPRFQARVDQLKDQFMAARAHQKGSAELAPVAEAVAIGRVDTLLVNGAQQLPGRFDRESGHILRTEGDDPHANDLLDDLAEAVLKMDGEVLVLPPDMMPDNASLAAIYRY